MRLVLLVALCMVSIAMQAEEWKRNYKVAGKPDILVTAGVDIDVDVRAWDNASVEAKVVTEGWPVKKIHIKENQEGDRIELESRPTAREHLHSYPFRPRPVDGASPEQPRGKERHRPRNRRPGEGQGAGFSG